jgi:hypothetical protein
MVDDLLSTLAREVCAGGFVLGAKFMVYLKRVLNEILYEVEYTGRASASRVYRWSKLYSRSRAGLKF